MKKNIPWLTIVIFIVLISNFLLFHFYENVKLETKLEIYSDFGAPYAIQIYQGQYWGLFFNRFLHTDLILLVINSIIFLFLGLYIQKSSTWYHFLFLLLFSTIFTSLIQLTLSNDAGIGFAPVNFFLFTYIYGKSLISKTKLIPYKHLLAIFSILIIIYLQYINQFSHQFGTEGMIAGWFSGLVVGIFSKNNKIQLLISTLILATSFITLFYSPWSAEWNYSQGCKYHLKYDDKNATLFYQKAIKINPNHEASQVNLTRIIIDELKNKALTAHENNDYINARKLYNEILEIDPDNLWAKENLNKLP